MYGLGKPVRVQQVKLFSPQVIALALSIFSQVHSRYEPAMTHFNRPKGIQHAGLKGGMGMGRWGRDKASRHLNLSGLGLSLLPSDGPILVSRT
jgi:hypothetical protein